jgi:serine/threonine-protein kinase
LVHPSILPVLDSGATDDRLWYTMPLVDGESLRDRLNREKQLPLDEAVRLTSEISDALGYAHAQGILHRDIKPENILLAAGHALVADFGIARALGR